MHIRVLSLFPEYFRGPLDESIVKRARENGHLQIELYNIRDWATGLHKKVDDRPYGGGPGMVMMPEPVCKAIRATKKEGARVIYMSPQGEPLKAKRCRELAQFSDLVLLAGHYEGIDERVIQKEVDEEISIGDFVLTNGCLAACVLIDSVIRFIPGVIGDEAGPGQDSFEGGLLDWPHYTRPEDFEGEKVPPVLLSGNHQEIAKWRHEMALEKTKRVRPDLYKNYLEEKTR